MTTEKLKRWIEKRYGAIQTANAGGLVFVATVKIWSGIATGLGSSEDAALADLYLDLRFDDHRGDVPTAATEWEKARRAGRYTRAK